MNISQIFGTAALILYSLHNHFSTYVEITPPHKVVFEFYKQQEGEKFEEDVKEAETFFKSEMSKQTMPCKQYTASWSPRPYYTFTASKRDFHNFVLWKAMERIFEEKLNHIVLEHSPFYGSLYQYTVYTQRETVVIGSGYYN